MKNINKIIASGIVTLLVIAFACKEPFDADPVPATSPSTLAANFIFGNASNADVDFYTNNIKTTEATPAGVGQTQYTHMSIPNNGGFGTAAGNLNLRGKATSGPFPAPLKSADIVFRGTNTNTNNFSATDSAYYTIIAIDTVNRPAPLRTYNKNNFGDTTFFNPLTGLQLSTVDRAKLDAATKAILIPLGTVPLGSTDPGGPRFLIITDQLPLPSATRLPKPAVGKASVRFVNAMGDASTLSVTFNGTAVGGTNAYPMVFPTFNPNVGSRSIASPAYTTLDKGTYTIVVKYPNGAGSQLTLPVTDFLLDDQGVYTFFISGSRKFDTGVIGYIKNK